MGLLCLPLVGSMRGLGTGLFTGGILWVSSLHQQLTVLLLLHVGRLWVFIMFPRSQTLQYVDFVLMC